MSTNASHPRFRSSNTADRDHNANASVKPPSNRISIPLKWKIPFIAPSIVPLKF